MLPVGVHDQPVEAAPIRPLAEPGETGFVDSTAELGRPGRAPEPWQVHLAQVRTHRPLPGRRHGVGRDDVSLPVARSITANPSAVASSHGPTSPSGHWTRTLTPVAEPSPKCCQPSWPLS